MTEKEELQKNRQILFSWNWFYLNSKNLIATRYHKSEIWSKKEQKKVLADVFIDDMWNSRYVKAVYHSKRMKEDRAKSYKLNKAIEDNQLKLAKFFNSNK